MRAWSSGLAALYLLIVICWSVGIRFNAAPDEYSHFFIAEYLLKFGTLPHQGIDPATPFRGIASGATYHSGIFWYYGMPNLHALGAAATAFAWIDIVRLPPSPLAVRAFNWLLSVPFLLSLMSIAGRTVRLAAPQDRVGAVALLAALSTALIPQVVFLFAYFNSDAFGLTVLAVSLALLLRLAERPTPGRAIACGGALGLVVVAKIYFLPALALLGLLAATVPGRLRSRGVGRTAAIGIGAAIALAVPILAATGAWYGDVTGMEGQRDFVRLYGDDPKFMKGTCFFLCSTGWVNIKMVSWWLGLSFKSFFYSLGWLDRFLPEPAYLLFFAPLCIGLIAASVAVLRAARGPRQRWQAAAVIGFWALLLLLVAANLQGSQRLLPQPQGRYLYGVIPFIPLLIGIASSRPTTAKLMGWLLPLATVGMLALNGVGAVAVRSTPPHRVDQAPGFTQARVDARP